MNTKLTHRKCVPCESGMPPMAPDEVKKYLTQVKSWYSDDKKIWKEFKFKNFVETMGFVNKVALLAQEEGHHPDMFVAYSRVKVELWTHAIGGLSENDFILAAKIDMLE
ncbi:MAG: 4a-hydroxytetrahydrobiopterin dehydratase [Candidatus Doudnabacteria bacterium]|nr:4a-hydroxytetrahydrobiopterin dehydratase [Candidatus Doudnabacteria bacterium]